MRGLFVVVVGALVFGCTKERPIVCPTASCHYVLVAHQGMLEEAVGDGDWPDGYEACDSNLETWCYVEMLPAKVEGLTFCCSMETNDDCCDSIHRINYREDQEAASQDAITRFYDTFGLVDTLEPQVVCVPDAPVEEDRQEVCEQ